MPIAPGCYRRESTCVRPLRRHLSLDCHEISGRATVRSYPRPTRQSALTMQRSLRLKFVGVRDHSPISRRDRMPPPACRLRISTYIGESSLEDFTPTVLVAEATYVHFLQNHPLYREDAERGTISVGGTRNHSVGGWAEGRSYPSVFTEILVGARHLKTTKNPFDDRPRSSPSHKHEACLRSMPSPACIAKRRKLRFVTWQATSEDLSRRTLGRSGRTRSTISRTGSRRKRTSSN